MVFLCPLLIAGYTYSVDWWSLGVVAYEMRAGTRPFIIHSSTPLEEVKDTLFTTPHIPKHWSANFCDLIRKVSTQFKCIYLYVSGHQNIQHK